MNIIDPYFYAKEVSDGLALYTKGHILSSVNYCSNFTEKAIETRFSNEISKIVDFKLANNGLIKRKNSNSYITKHISEKIYKSITSREIRGRFFELRKKIYKHNTPERNLASWKINLYNKIFNKNNISGDPNFYELTDYKTYTENSFPIYYKLSKVTESILDANLKYFESIQYMPSPLIIKLATKLEINPNLKKSQILACYITHTYLTYKHTIIDTNWVEYAQYMLNVFLTDESALIKLKNAAEKRGSVKYDLRKFVDIKRLIVANYSNRYLYGK